ncbi:MAG: BrnT family toxin [Nitrospirota bacterium]
MPAIINIRSLLFNVVENRKGGDIGQAFEVKYLYKENNLRIEALIWFDDIIEKLVGKHNVRQREVSEVLAGNTHFRFVEKGHRAGENAYAAMGQTKSGRYLIVFFVYKTDKCALILSARDMTKAERRLYEKT